MSYGDTTRWYELSGEDLARRTLAIATRLRNEDSARLERYRRAISMHGSFPLVGLQPDEFMQSALEGYKPLSVNLVRVHVTTARADLIQSRPRPQIVSSDGDYQVQERSKGLTKFSDGSMYADKFDRKARAVALMSALLGDGVLKHHLRDDLARTEIVFPWELFVDEQDAYDGDPRSMWQVKMVPRSTVAALWPKHRRAIDEQATEASLSGSVGRSSAIADRVKIVEAWHLPSAKGAKDGRHVIVCGDLVLHDERWDDARFPFSRLSWSEPVPGFWATGIAWDLEGVQLEMNETLATISECRPTVTPVTFVEKGSKVAKGHITNEVGAIVEYVGSQPSRGQLGDIPPGLVAHADWLWSRSFQITGVSELAAASMKPAGLNSGASLRAYADIKSARFYDWGVAWQDLYIDAAEQKIALMRRAAERNPQLDVVYSDRERRRVERIKWADVSLEEDSYLVQVYPVNAAATTPAGRLAQLDEWMALGYDPKDYRRVAGYPDLEAEVNLESAVRKELERVLSEMLYGSGRYVAPEPFYDLALARKLGTLHYLQGQTRGAPQERLLLLVQWMEEVAALQKQAAAAAATQPAPPGAPEALPPDGAGAPPMPPM